MLGFGKTKYCVIVDDDSFDLIIYALIEWKNKLIQEGRYTDAIDDALIVMEITNMNNEISFEITGHIGVIKARENGWREEINIVSWNGGTPKVDIRDWSPDHERMSKGITLTKDEFKRMIDVAKERMPGLISTMVDREER